MPTFMTADNVEWRASCARDDVPGYAAANDNESAQDRRALMAWAQSRMNDPAFRPYAVAAMFQAQRR